MKCIVKDCKNHKHEGGFNGDVCSPCYQFIVHGKGVNSQAYRNTHLAELTDKEIMQIAQTHGLIVDAGVYEFAKAILRKAKE